MMISIIAVTIYTVVHTIYVSAGDPHCERKDDGAPKYTQGVSSHPGFNEKSLPHFDNQLCEEDY